MITLDFIYPTLAEAQSNPLTQSIFSFLPILVLFVFLFFLFRYQSKSPAGRLMREERERHIKYMQKMEELAERIAKALERKE